MKALNLKWSTCLSSGVAMKGKNWELVECYANELKFN